jgi:hypothetical protein
MKFLPPTTHTLIYPTDNPSVQILRGRISRCSSGTILKEFWKRACSILEARRSIKLIAALLDWSIETHLAGNATNVEGLKMLLLLVNTE